MGKAGYQSQEDFISLMSQLFGLSNKKEESKETISGAGPKEHQLLLLLVSVSCNLLLSGHYPFALTKQ